MAMKLDPIAEERLTGKKSLRLLLILLAAALAVAFLGELLITLALRHLLPANASELTAALLDAGLLSVVLSTVLLPLMLNFRQRNLRVARRALRLQYTLDEHAIVSITDVTGRITFANDRFCQISGYSRQELIGQNHRMLKSQEHAPQLFIDMWRTIANGRTWHGDICNRSKTGGLYWVNATITPFMNARGKPEEYIAIRTEITAQKALEKAARQRELWLRTILDNLGEGVYTLDAQGMLSYLNPEAERLIGWRVDELEGKSLHHIIHHHGPDGNLLPAEECPLHLAMSENRSYRSSELMFFHKDGTGFPVSVTGAPLLADGEQQGSVAVFSDISEERLLQQRLQDAKNAAEEAARLKADFLSTMSHEIRTPLNGVIGMTDLLLTTPLDNEQSEFVRIIKLSADALLAIINDILDLSKIEAGRLILEHTEFSLRQIVEDCVDLLSAKAKEKELSLSCVVAAGMPDQLIGDPTRIRQILLNFLSNAIKFTTHGEVLASAELEAGASDERPVVKIAVRDSGIGLSEAAMANLFQPFSQADSSTTRKYGGTGLGLSICKRLAEAMAGEIGVSSVPGVGSTFWVRIPLALGAEKPAPPQAFSSAAAERGQRISGKRHLLLAEDNPINQRVAVHVLNKLGYAVDVVDNGALAVAAVAAGDYALVLMDCQMPEMDGFAATAAIRRAEADSDRHLTIVAMTANALSGDREQCLAAGMDDYIAKPVDAARLKTLLAAWLPEAATAIEALAPDLDAIDMSRLSALLGDDAAAIEELLTLFQHSLGSLRQRLDGEARNHGRRLKSIAYDLRGAAANVGAEPLVELARQLETLAPGEDWDEIEALVRRIDGQCSRTSDFISGYTGQRQVRTATT